MKSDKKKSKLALEREEIKVLSAKTGVKVGNVPPTYLCGGPSLNVCRSQKQACWQ